MIILLQSLSSLLVLDGSERTDAIAGFLAAARARLHPLGATVTADVFGLSMNESRDVGIGQQWERIPRGWTGNQRLISSEGTGHRVI